MCSCFLLSFHSIRFEDCLSVHGILKEQEEEEEEEEHKEEEEEEVDLDRVCIMRRIEMNE